MAVETSASKIRVVLRPEVTLDDIEEAALDLDWLFLRNWPASEERPYEDLWVDRDEQTSIHYIDDHLVSVQYLLISGPDARTVETEAREALSTCGPADATNAWQHASTRAERVEAVYLLALATDPADYTSAAELLRAAASDGDPEVRRAVILAATYVGWPELRAVLAELEERDPDESVRRDARFALEGLNMQDQLEG